MPLCISCGESVPSGMELCPMCGNALGGAPSSSKVLEAIPMDDVIEGIPMAEIRQCSICRTTYDALDLDAFCKCGGQLIDAPAIIEDEQCTPTDATQTEHVFDATVEQPPSMTRRLVLYGEDKNPIAHFAITKDVTLIGRLDAVEGVFPDIDLGDWFDDRIARRISRKHALVVRSRRDDVIRLRPLPGNTGTQIESDMVEPSTDHVLTGGTRIILGGVVRIKVDENG